MAARLVCYNVSLDPNPRIGILFIRVISKVSTAAAGPVLRFVYTAQPVVFNPLLDLGSARNASRFFSYVVSGHFGPNSEFTARITDPMAEYTFQVYVNEGRARTGVRIYAEFEVFYNGSALVLDSLGFQQVGFDYVRGILPNFVGSNSGMQSEFEAPGFLDGDVLVLDSLPFQQQAGFDHVDGILPNFAGSNSRMQAEFEAAGFMDDGVLVLDALPDHVQRPPTNFLGSNSGSSAGGFMDGALVLDSVQPFEDANVDGMTAAEISRLKKVTQICDGGGTCSVCLEDFSAGDLITPLTPCSHNFHAGCIAIWMKRKRTCPVCRTRCFSDDSPPAWIFLFHCTQWLMEALQIGLQALCTMLVMRLSKASCQLSVFLDTYARFPLLCLYEIVAFGIESSSSSLLRLGAR